ncbi:hypothetical protein ZWY2020_042190 [Hordeum vulgare]|nr:hypothetical protein ZWY2020_042190 [Hordeum vulgare]
MDLPRRAPPSYKLIRTRHKTLRSLKGPVRSRLFGSESASPRRSSIQADSPFRVTGRLRRLRLLSPPRIGRRLCRLELLPLPRASRLLCRRMLLRPIGTPAPALFASLRRVSEPPGPSVIARYSAPLRPHSGCRACHNRFACQPPPCSEPYMCSARPPVHFCVG